MQELKRVALNITEQDIGRFMVKYNVTVFKALAMIEQAQSEIVLVNDTYRVSVSDPHATSCIGWPDMIHLTINRHDMEPIENWDELQKLKNIVIGSEHEAIEIYPKESRLVNMGNQRHLWVFVSEDFQIPMGWKDRMVQCS